MFLLMGFDFYPLLFGVFYGFAGMCGENKQRAGLCACLWGSRKACFDNISWCCSQLYAFCSCSFRFSANGPVLVLIVNDKFCIVLRVVVECFLHWNWRYARIDVLFDLFWFWSLMNILQGSWNGDFIVILSQCNEKGCIFWCPGVICLGGFSVFFFWISWNGHIIFILIQMNEKGWIFRCPGVICFGGI